MKVKTYAQNSLRVALAPSTPQTNDFAAGGDWSVWGLLSIPTPSQLEPSQRSFRTKPGGHSSRGRSRSTANMRPYWSLFGLSSITTRPTA